MRVKAIVAVIIWSVAIILYVIRGPSAGVTEVAHESIRLHLGLYGSSIYEYHAATGKWPRQIDDLAMTTLPAQSPYWRHMLDARVNVIVWHKSLKANPADNADRILVYHNKGQLAEQGRSWVCWGDLRTEYIQTEELHRYLNNLKE